MTWSFGKIDDDIIKDKWTEFFFTSLCYLQLAGSPPPPPQDAKQCIYYFRLRVIALVILVAPAVVAQAPRRCSDRPSSLYFVFNVILALILAESWPFNNP